MAITALAYRTNDRAGASGLLTTPGGGLLDLAAGYVIWRTARERILDLLHRPATATDKPD
jgi:hypothetical protein